VVRNPAYAETIHSLFVAGLLLLAANGCGPPSTASNTEAEEPAEATASLECAESLEIELRGQARGRLQKQPAPEGFKVIGCHASAERARLSFKKPLGSTNGLFFLVYFERVADAWRFSFEDAVVLPLIREDGRPTDVSDVLKTRSPGYLLAGADPSD